MTSRCPRVALGVCAAAAVVYGAMSASPVRAHHSFSMYDRNKIYVFTGVVTRVNPDVSHLQIFFSPLNDARTAVIRDEAEGPVIWAVELRGAAQVAREGVTVDSFPPGTIFSIGLHPLRNGLPAGGRAEYGLYRCPDNTPPAPGMHCNSVDGATSHGRGVLPEPTGSWPERGRGAAR